MRLMSRMLQKAIGVLCSHAWAEKLIAQFAYLSGVDLPSLAHRISGVGCEEDMTVYGEAFFVNDVLPHALIDTGDAEPLFFDVGANTGEYCVLLRSRFPRARIHAFEPNPGAFERLQSVCGPAGIQAVKVGLSSQRSVQELCVPKNDLSSGHSSLYPEVFTRIHGSSDEILSRKVELRTVADYCLEIGIQRIDFMKIDTEGHEYAVLQGCADMLRAGTVQVIQFEFNQMNVMSRVFLKDFYDLLGERYCLFRLAPHALIPLGPYHTRNEIFIFQNIVALLRPLAERPEVARYIRR